MDPTLLPATGYILVALATFDLVADKEFQIPEGVVGLNWDKETTFWASRAFRSFASWLCFLMCHQICSCLG